MATYALDSSNGSITVPPKTSINFKDLELVGRDSPDWNKPIQQNFVKLADKLSDTQASTETLVTQVETSLNDKVTALDSKVGNFADFESSFETSNT